MAFICVSKEGSLYFECTMYTLMCCNLFSATLYSINDLTALQHSCISVASVVELHWLISFLNICLDFFVFFQLKSRLKGLRVTPWNYELRKATKLEKTSHMYMYIYICTYKCQNNARDLFKFLWPSHNILTLKICKSICSFKL